MIEKISLRIFWVCMILCAITVISMLWVPPMSPDGSHPPLRFQIAASLFVIGLSSVLVWVPLITYRFYKKIDQGK